MTSNFTQIIIAVISSSLISTLVTRHLNKSDEKAKIEQEIVSNFQSKISAIFTFLPPDQVEGNTQIKAAITKLRGVLLELNMQDYFVELFEYTKSLDKMKLTDEEYIDSYKLFYSEYNIIKSHCKKKKGLPKIRRYTSEKITLQFLSISASCALISILGFAFIQESLSTTIIEMRRILVLGISIGTFFASVASALFVIYLVYLKMKEDVSEYFFQKNKNKRDKGVKKEERLSGED